MKVSSAVTACSSLLMTTGAGSTSQISLGAVGLIAGEQGDGVIDGLLLLAEVEDVAVGLGVVEHAVGARERLDQAVVLEVLIDVEGVQVFGIEAGEQHVHDDDDVDLLGVRQVAVRVLLVLDALLHVLIVEDRSC